MRTAQEIVNQTNELARQFYAMRGYEVPEDFRFDTETEDRHPDERACWAMACAAQLLLTETDVEDAIQEMDGEDAAQKAEPEQEEQKPETGWGNPDQFNARSKFHYFTDGRSLCGKWARFPGSFELEEGNDSHSDNCAACKKKKTK